MEFRDETLYLDGVAATELAARHGTPLYVYEQSVIVRQMERVRRAFSLLPLEPFYAVKANDNVSILGLVREAGFGCDCVSPGELFLVKHAGFESRRLWFTSSNASDEDLLLIDDPALVINVNSIADIERCIALGLRNPLAIRVNPDVGAGHHPDVVTGGFGVKFGIELSEVVLARTIAEAGGLEVVGIHAHIGSGISDPKPLLESAGRLVHLIGQFPALRFINFGGGMSVPYGPGDREFPIEEYGAALAGLAGPELRRAGLTAIIEPGRYVVAESGTLLTRVTSQRTSSGYQWIGCDTGFNHLARPSKYGAYHHILNASRGTDSDLPRNNKAVDGNVIVAGNLCESGDVFTRDGSGIHPRSMAETAVGDLLAICDAGAYGFSMASGYNARPLPAEVMVSGGDARVIRERQTFGELLRGE